MSELYLFQNATFSLPLSAEVLNSNSSCGSENASQPSLTIAFGSGYSLMLSFTRNATRYRVQHMSFTYNLSDTQYFTNASTKGKTRDKRQTEGRVENQPFQEPREGLLGLPAFLSRDFLFLVDAGQRLSVFSPLLQAFSLPTVWLLHAGLLQVAWVPFLFSTFLPQSAPEITACLP